MRMIGNISRLIYSLPFGVLWSWFCCFCVLGDIFFLLMYPGHRLRFLNPRYLSRFLFHALSQGNKPRKMEIAEDSELVGW